MCADAQTLCTPDFSNAYISAKKEDNATKISGYDPLGQVASYKLGIGDSYLNLESWEDNFLKF